VSGDGVTEQRVLFRPSHRALFPVDLQSQTFRYGSVVPPPYACYSHGMPVAHPHDALFRKTFSDLDNATGQLRAVLPPRIVEAIEWDTLRLHDSHYVDESLEGSCSDLLYSAKLQGCPVAIYVLFEHQSTSDPWMAFRLLAYMVRIWTRWRDEHPEQKRLPAILPVVLSHAEGGWKAPLSFHGLIDFPPGPLPELEVYSPQFSYIVDDLSSQSDEQLMARTLEAMGMLTLLMLRHARDEQGISTLLEGWRELFQAIWQAEDGKEVLGIFIRYVLLANDKVTLQDLNQTLVPLLDQGVGEVIMTEGQRLIEKGRVEGRAEGRAEGRVEGRVEGRAEALLAVLRARGFQVSQAAQKRVESCMDVVVLEQWLVRAATVDSLDAVFDG